MDAPVQHRLLLCFRPPDPAIAEMARIRDAFRSRRRVPDGQLHMTLLPFPLSLEFPERLARRIIRDISVAELPSCRIIVDRLVLGPRSGLLQPSEPLHGLQSFQRRLVRLAPQGSGRRFSPHFT